MKNIRGVPPYLCGNHVTTFDATIVMNLGGNLFAHFEGNL